MLAIVRTNPEPLMSTKGGHQPVMLAEVIAALRPKSDGRYLDGTFGGGGHTEALLLASAPGGRVLAIDADPAAAARAADLAERFGQDRFAFVHANFAGLGEIACEHGMAPLDGILLDLGLSSFQLDEAERGFSFRWDAPLDMRFNPDAGVTAADVVNDLPVQELADLIWRYGEERRSRRIASAIERARATAPIRTTGQLAGIVEDALGGRRGAPTHPATQTFQALRIAVNDEFGVLERALAGAMNVLAPGGRLAVIAFHSLEDRIVKQFMAGEARTCICPPEQPVCTCDHRARLRLVVRGQKPGLDEVKRNSRSRSAVLRVAERLPDDPGTKPA